MWFKIFQNFDLYDFELFRIEIFISRETPRDFRWRFNFHEHVDGLASLELRLDLLDSPLFLELLQYLVDNNLIVALTLQLVLDFIGRDAPVPRLIYPLVYLVGLLPHSLNLMGWLLIHVFVCGHSLVILTQQNSTLWNQLIDCIEFRLVWNLKRLQGLL